MLHVQRPLSMPSSLVSEHHPHTGTSYQLPQLRDFGGAWNKTQSLKGGDGDLRGWPRGYTDQSLMPSPRVQPGNMNSHTFSTRSTHDRPLGASNSAAQNGLPYPLSQPIRPGHTRSNSKTQPFYQSYYSARQAQSPARKRENTTEAEQVVRRKPSSDGSSIASYLQIPATINNSKGSLPEFAAQVWRLPSSSSFLNKESDPHSLQITCLFWFESSLTLQLVQDVRGTQMMATALSPDAVPTTGFRKWVTTILSMTQVSQNVILLALMFIYRLKVLNPGVKGKVGSEFRLLTVALMLGNKCEHSPIIKGKKSLAWWR